MRKAARMAARTTARMAVRMVLRTEGSKNSSEKNETCDKSKCVSKERVCYRSIKGCQICPIRDFKSSQSEVVKIFLI